MNIYYGTVMSKTIGDICRVCGGFCCTTVFLGKSDIKKLNKAGKVVQYQKVEGGHEFVKTAHGKCPFLKEGIGCVLPEELKPFDCILYPLAFTKKNGSFEFYVNTKCPYYKEIPKDWIKKTILWFNDKIKEWTDEEIEAYIARQKGHMKKIEL